VFFKPLLAFAPTKTNYTTIETIVRQSGFVNKSPKSTLAQAKPCGDWSPVNQCVKLVDVVHIRASVPQIVADLRALNLTPAQ